MKLDFNVPIYGLDGQALPNANLGKLLAETLVHQPEGDVIKLYDWGLKLYNGGVIEVDRADQQYLENFIKSSKQITLLGKKQLLDIVNSTNGTEKT